MSNGNGSAAHRFEWLLKNFVESTAGVSAVTAVSSDGFLLASSEDAAATDLEQLAALVSGISSLGAGAVDFLGHGEMRNVLIETARGYLLVVDIGQRSSLAVVATANCNLGAVAHETMRLVERVGEALTPGLILELKNPLVA